MEEGLNILGAHIDSPRLDIKQNPLYEDNGLVLMDTHYYGGIKKYQWVALPLALHGVVALKDGTSVEVCIGEKEDDPVVGVSDLLIHLASEQMTKKADKVVEGEDLNVLVGSMPAAKKTDDSDSENNQDVKEEKERVKANILSLLKEKYGISGQISLTYDMTFVVILLSALYEPHTQKGSTRCIIHPVCKQPVRRNTVTEYAADMNVLLTYYKCRDDWEDEKKVTALGYSKVLQGKVKKLDQKYPDKSRRIQKLLSELSEMEKSGEKDIDKMAGCFGKIMEEIFAWKQDVWEDTLRRMGFFLGKFIYLLDAYDDVEEDIKNKNYNPFSEQYIIKGFDEQVRRILIMMMAQTCREFEKLPIIKYTDILRNILYSGVWCRFEVIHKKRKEAGEKDND